MVTVNKDALARMVSERAGKPSIAEAKATIDAVLDTIRERAEAGDTIRIAGFGSFSVKARPARTGRNPATGLTIEIPETRRLTFKAFKAS